MSDDSVMRLRLLKCMKLPEGEFYDFYVDGHFRRLSKESAILTIQKFSPSERNCKTDGTYISLKQGYGNMPVEVYNGQRKAIQQTNIALLYHNGKHAPAGVNMFTGKKYRELCEVFCNNTYFLNVQKDKEFLRSQQAIIKRIDEAEVKFGTPTKISTPYGVGDITDLSTGLKTLLNTLYLKEHTQKFIMVNIDECGDNILPYLFNVVNNSNVALYLNHNIHEIPAGYEIYLNRKKISTASEMLNILSDEGEIYTWSL